LHILIAEGKTKILQAGGWSQ